MNDISKSKNKRGKYFECRFGRNMKTRVEILVMENIVFTINERLKEKGSLSMEGDLLLELVKCKTRVRKSIFMGNAMENTAFILLVPIS